MTTHTRFSAPVAVEVAIVTKGLMAHKVCTKFLLQFLLDEHFLLLFPQRFTQLVQLDRCFMDCRMASQSSTSPMFQPHRLYGCDGFESKTEKKCCTRQCVSNKKTTKGTEFQTWSCQASPTPHTAGRMDASLKTIQCDAYLRSCNRSLKVRDTVPCVNGSFKLFNCFKLCVATSHTLFELSTPGLSVGTPVLPLFVQVQFLSA